jgi:hypothetical protein
MIHKHDGDNVANLLCLAQDLVMVPMSGSVVFKPLGCVILRLMLDGLKRMPSSKMAHHRPSSTSILLLSGWLKHSA